MVDREEFNIVDVQDALEIPEKAHPGGNVFKDGRDLLVRNGAVFEKAGRTTLSDMSAVSLSALTVTSGSESTIPFSGALGDGLGAVDAGNNQFSLSLDGLYMVFGRLVFEPTNAGTGIFRVDTNLPVGKVVSKNQKAIEKDVSFNFTHFFKGSDGDTIDFDAYQDTGSNQALSTNTSESMLGIARL